MSSELIYFLIVVFVFICCVAAFFIRKHYLVIKGAKEQGELQNQIAQKRYDEQRAYLIESIQVIARAVGNDEKLTYTEACMRLTVLLESLAPHLLQDPQFSAIYEVYRKTQHIPIKNDWKKLSKQKKWQYKKEMAKIESEFAKDVDEAAAHLVQFNFDLMLH